MRLPTVAGQAVMSTSETAPADAGMRRSFRDARALDVIRVMALVGAVLILGPTVAEMETHDLAPFLLVLGLGLATQVAALAMRARPLHDRLFELGLVLDVGVLGLLLHLSGGDRSPLLPLVIMWMILGVMTHQKVGAIAFSVLMAIMLSVVMMSHHSVMPATPYVLLVTTLVVALGAAVSAWFAVRQLEGYERQLLDRSLQDALTGLWNRRAFEQRLQAVCATAQRSDEPFALAMLDLDHFKRVNDEHGHLVGDDVLRETSAILNAAVRATDEVFRFGGEEFVVLMPATGLGDACAVSERVRRAVGEGHPAGFDLTVSVGVSVGTSVAVLADADRLLIEAKAAGRDRMACATRRPCSARAGAARTGRSGSAA